MEEYASLNHITMEDLQQLHSADVAGKPYTYCIVGSNTKISMEDMKKMGDV